MSMWVVFACFICIDIEGTDGPGYDRYLYTALQNRLFVTKMKAQVLCRNNGQATSCEVG